MNFERYKNKITKIHTELGTLTINRDRMIIGSLACMTLACYIESNMGNDFNILALTTETTSVALGVNAIANQYKIYIANQKYKLVQRFYYSQGKQKVYKKDNQ